MTESRCILKQSSAFITTKKNQQKCYRFGLSSKSSVRIFPAWRPMAAVLHHSIPNRRRHYFRNCFPIHCSLCQVALASNIDFLLLLAFWNYSELGRKGERPSTLKSSVQMWHAAISDPRNKAAGPMASTAGWREYARRFLGLGFLGTTLTEYYYTEFLLWIFQWYCEFNLLYNYTSR